MPIPPIIASDPNDLPIGDPRPSGKTGPAGDQRAAGPAVDREGSVQ